MTVKTVRLITSWITLSCISEKGPPLMLDPMRLAGTCKQYSKNAIPHENRITNNIGHPSEICICCSLRCPYHAKVIQMLDPISKRMVQTILQFIFSKLYCCYAANILWNLLSYIGIMQLGTWFSVSYCGTASYVLRVRMSEVFDSVWWNANAWCRDICEKSGTQNGYLIFCKCLLHS